MLKVETINTAMFRDMIFAGTNWLEQNKEDVDRLNVFPVPDGDTGTNMALTMQSSAKFVRQTGDDSIAALAEQLAYGALMGARGNSGVILSQILRGMSSVLVRCETIAARDLCQAFAAGAKAAYGAVSKPMEGTILTVVREAAEALTKNEAQLTSAEEALQLFIEAGHVSLDRTPELLPVLKQAGVVDAGARGLLYIIEGWLSAVQGIAIEVREASQDAAATAAFDHEFAADEDIVYPYCTEFLLDTTADALEGHIDTIKNHLNAYGDCLLVVGAGHTIKVHVHTDNLGEVLGYCGALGELDDIKINNMRAQNRLLQQSQDIKEESEYALIAVSNGEGMKEIFKSLGVTHIISGGQTMNPSTEDFLKAIDEVNARNIILLPNNKNIIMTAEQAAALIKDVAVRVIPTRTIPQGLSAILAYSPEVSLDDNVAEMQDAMAHVKTGEVTIAIRDTIIDGVEIHANQFMAIVDGKIVAAEDALETLMTGLVQRFADEDLEFVTLYAGEEVAEDDQNALLEALTEQFEDLEFELYNSGQQVYHYLLSAE